MMYPLVLTSMTVEASKIHVVNLDLWATYVCNEIYVLVLNYTSISSQHGITSIRSQLHVVSLHLWATSICKESYVLLLNYTSISSQHDITSLSSQLHFNGS